MSNDRLGPNETAGAIAGGVVTRRSESDLVRVSGPDALSYLQGQCSQDLGVLSPGGSTDALVLSTQGKIDALVRVAMVTSDVLLVEVAPGFGPSLYERLRRFKIRVKVDLEELRWPLVEVRGPEAATAVAPVGPTGPGPDGARLVVRWGGLVGLDLLGGEVGAADGLLEGDEETFEAARIEAGLPVMGRDLDERTIPQEAGVVAATVSFTKGCYTGQELVARIDARGSRVPRVLRGLVLVGAPAEPRPGDGGVLVDGEKELGKVTSLAWSPTRGTYVGLGYVRREVLPPAELVLVGLGGERWRVAVEALPSRGTPA